MFYDEHNPPHFHATYCEYTITIDIKTGVPIKGDFPNRQLKFVKEWCKIHREELLENWNKAQNGLPLNHIDPL